MFEFIILCTIIAAPIYFFRGLFKSKIITRKQEYEIEPIVYGKKIVAPINKIDKTFEKKNTNQTEIYFRWANSSKQTFTIHASNNKGLKVICNCSYGLANTMCYHRKSLFRGYTDRILDFNEHEFNIFNIWYRGSKLEVAFLKWSKLEAEYAEYTNAERKNRIEIDNYFIQTRRKIAALKKEIDSSGVNTTQKKLLIEIEELKKERDKIRKIHKSQEVDNWRNDEYLQALVNSAWDEVSKITNGR